VLAALGRGLQNEFPNPERIGCPGREILSRIAAHKMSLSQAEPHLNHLTSCSPCYTDFLQLQGAYRQRRTRMIFAVAASLLIAVGLASWAVLRQHTQQVAHAVVDLRERAISRGTEPSVPQPPLEIRGEFSRLDIHLPVGSADGTYEVRISAKDGSPAFYGQAAAVFRRGIASLSLDAGHSSVPPGTYILQLRKLGSEWSSYPLQVN
jgi:hypothetical protein